MPSSGLCGHMYIHIHKTKINFLNDEGKKDCGSITMQAGGCCIPWHIHVDLHWFPTGLLYFIGLPLVGYVQS